ncbi:MAG: NUDIX hydrolase [Acidimicrobiales bacterium]
MTAVALRDAATVMLVRDRDECRPARRDLNAGAGAGGSPGMEVLMLRRNLESTWVGGAHLFPGGALDAEDRSAEMASFCRGRSDAEASAVMGVVEGGGAFFVAAVRECFEEAGILLAATGAGPVSFSDPADARRFEEHRRRLNAGEVSLASICRDEGLVLELDRLGYFSHWITPEGSPRRYDTRFFVAVVPEHQEALCDDHEVVDSIWIEPGDALERHAAGEIDLLLPTTKNLEAISRFTAADDLLAAAAAVDVPAIQPRLAVEGPGVRIMLPGDPGYEAATGLPPGAPFPGARHRAGPG